MTNKDSLSHAACKRTDTVFSNFTKQTFSPNCAIGLLHSRPVLLISLVFPSWPILILFMTCAAKRGSQLSNGLSSAMRTLVFCSAEIRRVLHLSFHFSHSHSHTTVGHVITLGLSLRNHFHSYTCVNHRILDAFVLGSLSHFKMILRKPRSLMKPTRNETQYAVGLFRSQHVATRLSIPAVSTNQNWKRVCVFLSDKPKSKATIGVVLSLASSSNSSIRCCPPTPRPSTQAAHKLL